MTHAALAPQQTLTEKIRQIPCPLCNVHLGPCQCQADARPGTEAKAEGDHLARYQDALRNGMITRGDMSLAYARVGNVVTRYRLVPAQVTS